MLGTKDAVVNLSWNHKKWEGFISNPNDECIKKTDWQYVKQTGMAGEWWNFNFNEGFPNQHFGRIYGYASMGAAKSTDCLSQKKQPVFNGPFPQGNGVVFFVSKDVHQTGRKIVGFYGKAMIHGLEATLPQLKCDHCHHIFQSKNSKGSTVQYVCAASCCSRTLTLNKTSIWRNSIKCPNCSYILNDLWCKPLGPSTTLVCRVSCNKGGHSSIGPHICITSGNDPQIPPSQSPQWFEPLLSGEIDYSSIFTTFLDAKSLIPCISNHTRKVHFPYLIDRQVTKIILNKALSTYQDETAVSKIRNLLKTL